LFLVLDIAYKKAVKDYNNLRLTSGNGVLMVISASLSIMSYAKQHLHCDMLMHLVVGITLPSVGRVGGATEKRRFR
jgi:hypothetical protein